jgi:putative tricarboxylic transport membrane protein
MHRLLRFIAHVYCAIILLQGTSAGAAAWEPTEKVVLVTHATSGASIDLLMRQLADIWTKHNMVSRPVAVENVMGSGGDKARRYVVQQNRGNPHMLFGFTPQMMIGPLRAGSDINVGSYTPIAMLAVDPSVMFVHADSPYKSVKDLIEAARQKPKSVLQGGGQFGGPPSLMGRMMADAAKVEIAYTPFKTSLESVVALLGKHVHFIMEQPSEGDQHVKSGKLRMLATSVPLEQYPSLPTYEASGLKFRVLKSFRGILAPPGLPREAVDYYVRLLDRTRATPEWKEYLKKFEVVDQWMIGKAYADWLDEEEKTYARVSRELGLMK